jgi:hypothetical protein
MKQAVILILIMFTLNVFSQENKNTIMLVHQPQDLGLGLRYDRLFPNYGMYLSLTTGNYKLPYGGYIKDHHKIALGASKRAFTTRNTYLTIGKWVHEGGCTHLNGFTYEYVVIREIDVTSEEIENAIIDFV